MAFTVARGIHHITISTDSIQWADVAILPLCLFTDCKIQQKCSKAHYSHPMLPSPEARTAPITSYLCPAIMEWWNFMWCRANEFLLTSVASWLRKPKWHGPRRSLWQSTETHANISQPEQWSCLLLQMRQCGSPRKYWGIALLSFDTCSEHSAFSKCLPLHRDPCTHQSLWKLWEMEQFSNLVTEKSILSVTHDKFMEAAGHHSGLIIYLPPFSYILPFPHTVFSPTYVDKKSSVKAP